MLEIFYEKIMKLYAEGENRLEVHKARAQFFEWAGQYDETSYDFAVKMSVFMDWYLLDRPFEEGELPPIQLIKNEQLDLEEDEEIILEGLKKSTHSIFEFSKVKKDQLFVKDLFSGEKLTLSDVPILSAFTKEQLFEARVLPFRDKFIFSGGFCFHPPEVSKFILKEVKLVKKNKKKVEPSEYFLSQKKLINRLMAMKYKAEQYKHLDLKEIYSNNSKIKV